MTWTSKSALSDFKFYFGIYVSVCLLSCSLRTFAHFYFFNLSIKGSKALFNGITRAVLRTPLRWMDTVPLGRVLNRFTADFAVIDVEVVHSLSWGLGEYVRMIAVTAVG